MIERAFWTGWRASHWLAALCVAGMLMTSYGCGGETESKDDSRSAVEHSTGPDAPAAAAPADADSSAADSTDGAQPRLTRRERILAETRAWIEQNQQLKVAESKPPLVGFRVAPLEGWAELTYFRFDASLSSDEWDLTGQLEKRWDFDGDGTWDSEISRRTRVNHMYSEPGTYRPRLWVRNSSGQVDSLTGDPLDVYPACPPPDFALLDVNPNSASQGETFRLSDQRGHRVLLWYTAPSK